MVAFERPQDKGLTDLLVPLLCSGTPKGSKAEKTEDEDEDEKGEAASLETKNSNQKGRTKGRGKKV